MLFAVEAKFRGQKVTFHTQTYVRHVSENVVNDEDNEENSRGGKSF